MSKVYYKTQATESGREVLMKFTSKKLLQKADETGAVVEKGITIYPLNRFSEGGYAVPVEDNHNNSMNRPQQPYMENGAAYYPFETTEEMIEIYKLIKKIANCPEEFDIRQLDSLGEKIKFVYGKSFFQDRYPDSKVLSGLKQTCFYLWLVCGTINAIEGKPLLYTLQYLCAILQLDVVTLTQIIMSSTISDEKKNYILNNIKAYGINPEVINEDMNARFYVKLQNEEFIDALLSSKRK